MSRVEVFAFAALEPHLDRIARASFDGGCDILPAEAGFDGVEHILSLQAVARHGFAISFDLEKRLALHAAWRDAGRAGNQLTMRSTSKALFCKRVEIVAENFHAELRANAGARSSECGFQSVGEIPARDPGTSAFFPPVRSTSFCFVMPGRHCALRFEHDRRFDHLGRRGVG